MKFRVLTIASLLSFSINVQATELNWLDWFNGFGSDSVEQLSGGRKGNDPMTQLSGGRKGDDPMLPSSGGRKGDDPVQQLSGGRKGNDPT
jgi:hypothetical protein